MTADRSLGADAVLIARYPGALASERGASRGVWTLEKFNAPVEWYAERIARSRGTQDDEAAATRLVRAASIPFSAADGRIPSFADLPPHLQALADAAMRADVAPYDIAEFTNGLLNAGITALWNIFFGNTSAANSGASPAGANAIFNNAQARIAVGDSAAAFAATQTWLQAATNKFAQGMDATFPSVAAQTISFKITVAGANANFSWQEFVVDNANGSNSTSTTLSGGSALDRAVSNQGTKTAGQTWVPTVQVTLS